MATKKTTTAKKSPAKKTSIKAKTVSRKPKVTAESIRMRAAEIYGERLNKGNQGDELSDWLQAEKELSTTN